MPSSPKIPKETILKYALDLVIHNGYAALNIKALASKIGCSTQPISWHFGNMEGLRKALAEYAHNYANQLLCPTSNDASEAFTQVGRAYIHIAIEQPYLFQFLYMNGNSGLREDSLDALIKDEENVEIIQNLALYYKISTECAGRYVQDVIIYTHGLASFLATGVLHCTEDEIMEQIHHAADSFLITASKVC